MRRAHPRRKPAQRERAAWIARTVRGIQLGTHGIDGVWDADGVVEAMGCGVAPPAGVNVEYYKRLERGTSAALRSVERSAGLVSRR